MGSKALGGVWSLVMVKGGDGRGHGVSCFVGGDESDGSVRSDSAARPL